MPGQVSVGLSTAMLKQPAVGPDNLLFGRAWVGSSTAMLEQASVSPCILMLGQALVGPGIFKCSAGLRWSQAIKMLGKALGVPSITMQGLVQLGKAPSMAMLGEHLVCRP